MGTGGDGRTHGLQARRGVRFSSGTLVQRGEKRRSCLQQVGRRIEEGGRGVRPIAAAAGICLGGERARGRN